MIRPALVLALCLATVATGCFSLPPPEPSPRATAGTLAPDFELASTLDPARKVTLDELTRDTTLVLVFYRGDW